MDGSGHWDRTWNLGRFRNAAWPWIRAAPQAHFWNAGCPRPPGNSTSFEIVPANAVFRISPPGGCAFSVSWQDSQGGVLFGNVSASQEVTAYVLGGSDVPFNGGSSSCTASSSNNSSADSIVPPTSYLFRSALPSTAQSLTVPLSTSAGNGSTTWELVLIPVALTSETSLKFTSSLTLVGPAA